MTTWTLREMIKVILGPSQLSDLLSCIYRLQNLGFGYRVLGFRFRVSRFRVLGFRV